MYIVRKNLSRHKNCLRNISLSLTLYSFFQSFPSPLSRTIQKWEKSLPAWSQLSDYHSDNHHDCRRKVWTCRGQAWPLITKRSWERRSLSTSAQGSSLALCGKHGEHTHFLSKHLTCSNQHHTERKITLSLASWAWILSLEVHGPSSKGQSS